ncbi:DUF3515 family protein [Streptacidiphilus cavernicola]|uniref:DUF3515 family protein n=1 Tax=Streptacidiphilus cavernicola TaxID=3342716 RepID=A0ABV6W329_9ACTN
MTPTPARHALLSAAALAAALLLAACSGGSVRVAAPATTGAAGKQCAALKAALPATLDGKKRRGTSPAAATAAAWGDPAIVLRCGVPQPDVLDPHSPAYDPHMDSHDAEEVNGVCWTSEPVDGGGFRYTTLQQQAYVEVTVPGAYAHLQSPIGGLAGPIQRTDPVDRSRPFSCD